MDRSAGRRREPFATESIDGAHVMKNVSFKTPVLLVAALVAACFAGQAAADDPAVTNAAELLEALRVRDARFDNCTLHLTHRETKHIDEEAEFNSLQFSRVKFGGEPATAPAEFPEPYDATLIHNGQLTVRGDDFLLTTVWLTDSHGHPQPAAAPILWGRFDGIERSLDMDPDHRMMYINQPPADESTLLQWKRMAYELSLGVGYGRWLLDISEFVRTDAGWSITGSMQLFRVDRTTCELELDDDLIIRNADIYCIVGPDGATRERRFIFSNSGVIEDSNGPLLAAEGSFRETTEVAVVRGQSQEVDRPGDAWKIDAGPVEFDLSDERYSELTHIDEDAAEHVIDRRRR